MNKIAFALLCSTLSAASAYAADAPLAAGTGDEPPATGQAVPSSEQTPDSRRAEPLPRQPQPSSALNAAAPAESDSKKGTGGVFLPSEEISEDFAVSFPVDI